MKIKINGREVEAPEDLTMQQAYEVEHYLGIDISSAKSMGATMALLFTGLRLLEPDTPPEVLALEVQEAKITTLDVAEDDVSPPAEAGSRNELKPNSGLSSENGSDQSINHLSASGSPL